jgi:pimeloyl-ACP methyl ester carboxylesterase
MLVHGTQTASHQRLPLASTYLDSRTMPTVQTSLLEITYRDDGPRDGPVVLLLHGWPDDASAWDAIIPALNDAGFRTIAPTHRGFGETRFLSPDTPRTGNTAMLALDAIEMLDTLGIERFANAGHDWGANMAEMLAVGWPDRVARIAMLSTPPRLAWIPTEGKLANRLA